MKPLSFIIVGSGFRSLFFARIAKQYPQFFELKYMLCRTQEKAQKMQDTYGIPTSISEEECEAANPDFVIIAVSRSNLYEEAKKWGLKGYPVLAETPLGTSVEEMKEIWQLAQEKKVRVQVAEQYHRYPIIAAGLEAVRQGKIGDPYIAELSLCHDYHGASVIRRMLQVKPGLMELRGEQVTLPVRETDSRYGIIRDGSIGMKDRAMVTIHFEGGKQAYYDFSSVQYRTNIRARHINVQGQEGEWNDTVVRYAYFLNEADATTEAIKKENCIDVKTEYLTARVEPQHEVLLTPEIERQTGTWEPFVIMDQAQDEFAIASMMYDMRKYMETGEEVYPLADALEDSYTWLLIAEAAAHPGEWIRSEKMPWHE